MKNLTLKWLDKLWNTVDTHWILLIEYHNVDNVETNFGWNQRVLVVFAAARLDNTLRWIIAIHKIRQIKAVK